VEFRVKVESAGRDGLEVEVGDRYGNRPVRLIFGPDGWLRARDGARMVEVKQWKAGEWVEVEARVGVDGYGLTVGGASAIEKAALAEAVLSFERISFRTGAYRNEPSRRLDRYDPRLKDLEGADEPVAEGVFRIEGLRVTVR
jgi:hypothetical protein